MNVCCMSNEKVLNVILNVGILHNLLGKIWCKLLSVCHLHSLVNQLFESEGDYLESIALGVVVNLLDLGVSLVLAEFPLLHAHLHRVR